MSRRLLLIEDSPTQAQELKQHYEELGYQVTVARDGESGIETLKAMSESHNRRPDLIVLDYLLPGANGIEVCRHLKSQLEFRSIPVLIYSIEKNNDYKLSAYQAGADYYVVKDANGQKILDGLIDAMFLRLRRLATQASRVSATFRHELTELA